MIVVDASAILDFLAEGPLDPRLYHRVQRETLHAPHLLDLEVTNALRRYCSLGRMTWERATALLSDYNELRIERHSHLPYLGRVWDLRHNFTAYDAVYLALAEALGVALLTRDSSLANAPIKHGRVEVV